MSGDRPTSKRKLAAAALNKKEQRRQALAFGALGLVGGPAAAATLNYIARGNPLPVGVKSVPRWLAASAAAGAITGGLLPTLQRRIGDSIQADANLRAHRQRTKKLKTASVSRLSDIVEKALTSGLQQRALDAGLGATLGALIAPVAASMTGPGGDTTETTGRDVLTGAIAGAIGGLASGLGAGAVGGLLGGGFSGMFDRTKKASQAGQDLRVPVMGGMKFPTADSTGAAQKKLQQSSAEVGPQPAPTYSMMGKMKKAAPGDDMDPMIDDPLIQYLQKTAKDEAKDQPPLTGLVDGSELKDNLSDMPRGEEEREFASEPPGPTPVMESNGKGETKSVAVELFSNSQAMRKKYDDKDHPFEGFDQGVVDRILGL